MYNYYFTRPLLWTSSTQCSYLYWCFWSTKQKRKTRLMRPQSTIKDKKKKNSLEAHWYTPSKCTIIIVKVLFWPIESRVPHNFAHFRVRSYSPKCFSVPYCFNCLQKRIIHQNPQTEHVFQSKWHPCSSHMNFQGNNFPILRMKTNLFYNGKQKEEVLKEYLTA